MIQSTSGDHAASQAHLHFQELAPVGHEEEQDTVSCSGQLDVVDQQSEQHEVREGRSEIHDL